MTAVLVLVPVIAVLLQVINNMKLNILSDSIKNVNDELVMESVVSSMFSDNYEQPMIFEPPPFTDNSFINVGNFFNIRIPKKENMLIRFTDI